MSTAAYERARNASRRREVSVVRAVCAWCDAKFMYRRGVGRPRKYCSAACIAQRSAAEQRALYHERGGRVYVRCSPKVRCSVCSP